MAGELRTLAALVALTLAGCLGGVSAPAEPVDAPSVVLANERPATTPEARAARGACYAAFDHVAAAWEQVAGPLSAECRSVADGFEVRLVEVVPCKGPGGAPTDGCAVLEQNAVYVLEDQSPAGQVFTAAHEWVHVLAGCVDGDSDHDHVDQVLWSLKDGVLGLAVEDLPVGPCVEGP